MTSVVEPEAEVIEAARVRSHARDERRRPNEWYEFQAIDCDDSRRALARPEDEDLRARNFLPRLPRLSHCRIRSVRLENEARAAPRGFVGERYEVGPE